MIEFREVEVVPFEIPNSVDIKITDDIDVYLSLSDLQPKTLSDLCDDFRKRIFERAVKAEPEKVLPTHPDTIKIIKACNRLNESGNYNDILRDIRDIIYER